MEKLSARRIANPRVIVRTKDAGLHVAVGVYRRVRVVAPARSARRRRCGGAGENAARSTCLCRSHGVLHVGNSLSEKNDKLFIKSLLRRYEYHFHSHLGHGHNKDVVVLSDIIEELKVAIHAVRGVLLIEPGVGVHVDAEGRPI